jgi:hypothetical protein
MIQIRKGILIVKIPQLVVKLLKLVDGCKNTILSNAQCIDAHAHDFLALYFTQSVKWLRLANEVVKLPKSAAVFVLPKTTHGWDGVQENTDTGIIAHFHRGHAAHHVLST